MWITFCMPMKGKEKTEQRRKEAYPSRGGAAVVVGGGDGGRRFCSFFSFSLSPLFFVILSASSSSFLFFGSSPSPLLLLSSLLFSLSFFLLFFSSSSRSLFFLVPSPYFYRQKQGRETWLGRPLCCRRSTASSTRGKGGKSASFWRSSRGGKSVRNKGEKQHFLPCSLRVLGKKMMVPFKTAPFWVFF